MASKEDPHRPPDFLSKWIWRQWKRHHGAFEASRRGHSGRAVYVYELCKVYLFLELCKVYLLILIFNIISELCKVFLIENENQNQHELCKVL